MPVNFTTKVPCAVCGKPVELRPKLAMAPNGTIFVVDATLQPISEYWKGRPDEEPAEPYCSPECAQIGMANESD